MLRQRGTGDTGVPTHDGPELVKQHQHHDDSEGPHDKPIDSVVQALNGGLSHVAISVAGTEHNASGVTFIFEPRV